MKMHCPRSDERTDQPERLGAHILRFIDITARSGSSVPCSPATGARRDWINLLLLPSLIQLRAIFLKTAQTLRFTCRPRRVPRPMRGAARYSSTQSCLRLHHALPTRLGRNSTGGPPPRRGTPSRRASIRSSRHRRSPVGIPAWPRSLTPSRPNAAPDYAERPRRLFRVWPRY